MSVIFKPTSVTNLYALENATGWIGYLLPSQDTHTHTSITLEDSLNSFKGIYLFASKKPNIEASNFASSIWIFLNKNSRGQDQRCFLWLNQDNNTRELDFGQILVFNHNSNHIATAKAVNHEYKSQHLLINESIFIAIPPYCKVSITGKSIIISRRAISTPSSFKHGMYLTNTAKNTFISLGNIDSRGPTNEDPITIPMSGANSGCLQFSLSFPFTFSKNIRYFIYENDQYPYNYKEEYTILETGVKYFYQDTNDKGDTEMMYFLFNQDTPSGFKGSLDFSDVFNTQNPRRTYFAFTGENIENQKESGNTLLPSNFQTNFGKGIQLEPVVNFNSDGSPEEDAALLVFSNAIIFSDCHNKRYYWVPQGDFTLQSINNTKKTITSAMLLCGISGTETVNFTPQNSDYNGDRISFSSKKPAYCEEFKSLQNPTDLTTNTKLLTNKYTSSWANIIKAPIPQGSSNNYYSQPNQAPLFEQGQVNGTLDYAEVPSANLVALVEEQASFPIATSAKAIPVLGLLTPGSPGYYEQKDITRFENEVLNPSRKQTIAGYYKAYRNNMVKAQAGENTACPIENLTTTPQGFLVNLNSDKTEWKCLTLANNEPNDNSDDALTLPPPLRFREIDTKSDITSLQSAFQTNEQFLVISDPNKPDDPEILDYYIHNFQDEIGIADWPFVFDIAHQNTESNTNAEFTNIIIFKFCNKSIEERIADPKLWTDPNVFNDENKIPQLIKWIQNYIETARESVKLRSNDQDPIQSQGFQQFLNIIEDQNWHGVLTLQVTLNLESLPSEIKAILAGIDTSRFAAHHIGIEANQIKTNASNQLDPNFKSSLFGMISYFNTTYLDYQNGTTERPAIYPNSPGTFDFQVLDLQVLFKNSLISDFNSKIQLNMNRVFDDIVIAESNANTDAIYKYSILMNGQYDKKNGSTSYTFSVATPNTLSLSSTAIDEVTITDIEMSTIDDVPDTKKEVSNIAGKIVTTPAKDAQITTRFIISGILQFQTIEDFDLFSYESLSFSNLMLDMEFNLDAISPIDNTPEKTFTFLPSNIVFNRSASTSRPDSLVSNFPIELESLLYNNAKNTPNKPITTSSLGYMQVEAPLPTAPVGNTWYALRFKLNMGSLGALASKVGFNSEVILAWSPGKHNNKAQIYAKMPFSGGIGGTNFNIQGVLKFAIGSILFFNDPETNQYAMILTEVGVSLLGKKLPPGGSTILYLFGNPDTPGADASGKSNVGWFGAYKKKGDKQNNTESQKKLTV